MRQTVEYITLQLLQGNGAGDETVQGFLDKYDFFIFPIVNPDGMTSHIHDKDTMLISTRLLVQPDD